MEKKRNMEHSSLGGIYMKWGKKISLFFVIFVFLLNFPASVLFFPTSLEIIDLFFCP